MMAFNSLVKCPLMHPRFTSVVVTFALRILAVS